ncbi:MAG: hypothetical protein ICV56_00700 [Nitrososphaeraceae archaeon]|nr:hypothetical protein [Nitrososphaeraceae archaeon]
MNNDNNRDSKEDSQGFTKTWVIEWTSGLGKKSHQEKDDYSLALQVFNEKSKQGEVLLYEVQKNISDGSVLKKIPILNSKKAKKRKDEAVKKVSERSETGKKKFILSDIKLRIIILASVVGTLIVILFLINSYTNTGNILSHHVVVHLSNVDYLFYSIQTNEIFSSMDRLDHKVSSANTDLNLN